MNVLDKVGLNYLISKLNKILKSTSSSNVIVTKLSAPKHATADYKYFKTDIESAGFGLVTYPAIMGWIDLDNGGYHIWLHPVTHGFGTSEQRTSYESDEHVLLWLANYDIRSEIPNFDSNYLYIVRKDAL